MNRTFKLALIVLACGLWQSANAQDAELLLHLPFDGSAMAAKAGGASEPIKQEALVYGAGIAGQAVEVKEGSQLAYARKGNLRQKEGTVTMWFKPNWSIPESNRELWRCFFAEPRPRKGRNGSGALWFWLWGNRLRGDISDFNDSYRCASVAFNTGEWHHLAFSWNAKGQNIYFDGTKVTADRSGDSSNILKLGKKGGTFAFTSDRFDTFFVGNHRGNECVDGWIDEFKVYNRMLTAPQILDDVAQVLPVKVKMETPYLLEPADSVHWSIENCAHQKRTTGTYTVAITAPDGKKLPGQSVSVDLAPGEKKEFSSRIPAPMPGKYQFKLLVDNVVGKMGALSASFCVLNKKNRLIGKVGGKLKTTPVLSLHIPDLVGGEGYVDYGDTHKGTLGGVEYLEAGSGRNDRFAIHLTLPEDNLPYWVEWDYPDDKWRTMDVVLQSAQSGKGEYMYHTGVFCGDEYPNTNKMLTFRSIFWARNRDLAMIFMSAREGAPAAVSDLRISRIRGPLPQAEVTATPPVDKWTRAFGIYFEDPAISYDFGLSNGNMPAFEQTMDRLIAYMKWTGQNFFAYPGVWYHGAIGQKNYLPRMHPEDYLNIILSKFEMQKLTFMPTINLHTVPISPDIEISHKAFEDGSLHATPVMIQNDGKPNPGRFHGSPPLFNPLHPVTQKCVDGYVDDLLARCGDSPAFKGVILHLTMHTTPWFGTIKAGYNDYNIDLFEKDTGIKIPVSRDLPLRGKLYYEWLMANAKEKWIAWRCRKISEWYLDIAARVKAKRDDLKLGIFVYRPVIREINEERYGTPGSTLAFNREAGFDPEPYKNTPNIIVSQTLYPADYRWSEGKHYHKRYPETRERMRKRNSEADTYATLEGAPSAWINMHDRYFEDAIGRLKKDQKHWSAKNAKPLEADWLRETGWRVSTLNSGENYFLDNFVLPLKYNDILGFCKGGFLVGTHGMEDKLREFAAAYRPLPAKKFMDIHNGGQLTVRGLQHDGDTWFYLVNTSHDPTEITLEFDRSPGEIQDLGSGSPIKRKSKTIRFPLGGYQLRSFKIKGKISLGIAD